VRICRTKPPAGPPTCPPLDLGQPEYPPLAPRCQGVLGCSKAELRSRSGSRRSHGDRDRPPPGGRRRLRLESRQRARLVPAHQGGRVELRQAARRRLADRVRRALPRPAAGLRLAQRLRPATAALAPRGSNYTPACPCRSAWGALIRSSSKSTGFGTRPSL